MLVAITSSLPQLPLHALANRFHLVRKLLFCPVCNLIECEWLKCLLSHTHNVFGMNRVFKRTLTPICVPTIINVNACDTILCPMGFSIVVVVCYLNKPDVVV